MALPLWAADFPWVEIHEAAGEYGVEPSLIAAIIQTESSGNPLMLRAEPKYEYLVTPARFAERLGITKETEIACQKLSWGHMQLMGGTARELGFEGHLCQLLFPSYNINYGTMYFASRLKKYKFMRLAIATYNSGSPVYNPDGELKNQKYVDKVLQFFEELK